jgi:hypothetical protein
MREDIDSLKEQIIKWLTIDKLPRAEICRKLGCKYDTLKRRLDAWGLQDIKYPIIRGSVNCRNRVHASVHLKENHSCNSNNLKLKLFRDGYKEKKCEKCGIESWQKLPAPLQLDHIDGNRYNNKLENLRILCANCHAQTETYAAKNVGSYKTIPE